MRHAASSAPIWLVKPVFSEEDRDRLFEAILSMYEYQRSTNSGQLAVVSPLILFRHTGTDNDEAQRSRQARLGCAPAHRLFELASVTKKAGVDFPRSRFDYDARIRLSQTPDGVEIGFLPAGTLPSPGGICRKARTGSRPTDLFSPPRMRRVLKSTKEAL